MVIGERVSGLRKLLFPACALLESGLSAKALRAEFQRGEWVRVSRGFYARASEWQSLTVREQHVLRILAVAGRASNSVIFSHQSAAILLGLPLLQFRETSVHTRVPPGNTIRSRGSVIRHQGSVAENEIVAIGGLHCTSPLRTVLDLAREGPFEAAIIPADAVLKDLSIEHHIPAHEATLSGFAAGSLRGRMGRVVRFASALAESPLESLTPLQLSRAGFEFKEQVEVPGPRSTIYRLDFELLGHDTFLEADGAQKYADARLRGGRSGEEILLQEKQREDWVRGVTGKRVVRCAWGDVLSEDRLSRRLSAFGIVSRSRLNAKARAELR